MTKTDQIEDLFYLITDPSSVENFCQYLSRVMIYSASGWCLSVTYPV
ncbi:MAG: hypothetical protein K6A81_11435 [Clostridiales bacterium]|nr:hypothetical protein [Clostridiales bacterium]